MRHTPGKIHEIMIRPFAVLRKLLKLTEMLFETIQVQELMDSALGALRGTDEDRCPGCGSPRPEYSRPYARWVTDWVDGRTVDIRMATALVKCKACGRHSVVLNALVIPYGRHSLRLAVHALADYFNGMRISDICAKYLISPPTIYRWKEKFLRDKEAWLKALDGREDGAGFIGRAFGGGEWPAFLKGFIQENAERLSFMQIHRNACLHRWVWDGG